MQTQIFEAAGSLTGLPKHWIKYLAERRGKGTGYGRDLGGEHSVITPIENFDPVKIRKALKDENNLAIIGKINNEPLFMIAPHYDFQTKYHFFETTPKEGYYDSFSKGIRSQSSKRSFNRRQQDSFTLNEVIDLVDQMIQNKNDDFSDLTIEAISKDPERQEKIKQRVSSANIKDPLHADSDSYWGIKYPNISQRQRAKKYAELKQPKLDARIETEKQKIKTQINSALDKIIDKVIDNVKRGYTFNVNKSAIATQLAKELNLSSLEQLTKAYSAIDTSYSSKHPEEIYKELKRTNIDI